jgi:HPt (histidine-containing phosphotransfer) domain-containing protein
VPRTEVFPGPPVNPASEDLTFEDVRLTFLIRLHSEETRLELLCAALEVARGDRISALVDLEMFAHRLRGAAAVFDLPEIRDAAKGLELTAATAATSNAPADEPQVQEAVRTLAARLSCLNGFTRDSTIPPTPAPVN